MKKLIPLYFLILAFTIISCRKIIDIDTTNAPAQIVIEGEIINRLTDQKIKISKTVGYSEVGIYPKVSGAVVWVSDSKGNSFAFIETEPGVYNGRMEGISGETYSLRVNIDGKEYNAFSKMPNLVKLDSIGIVTNNFFGNELKTAAAYLVDPIAETNYYHFNLYVNNVISKRFYASNDRLTNGNKLRIQLFYEENEDDDEGLKSGDQLTVEMEDVDANIFDYWYALSEQSGRGPNQGTTPSNPPSNISNGALGYFSAHTYQRTTSAVK